MPKDDWFAQFEAKPDSGFATASRDALPAAGQPQRGTQWQAPNYAARAVNTLPGVGAMVGTGIGGALGGPPGAALGAGVGSVAGQWGRYGLAPMVGLEAQQPSLQSPWATAIDMGLGALGAGGAASAKPIAEGVGRMAYRPAVGMQRSFKGLKPEPTTPPTQALIRQGLKNKATVGRVLGRGGSEATNAARERASAASAAKIEAAEAAGTRITVADLAEPSLRRARQAKRGALSPKERQDQIAEVRARANEILSEGTVIRRMRTVFTPSEVDLIRQRTQQNLAPTMNQASQGKFKSPTLENDLMVGSDKAIKGAIPGLRSARSTERGAIGVSRMVEDAEMRGRGHLLPILGGFAAGGHGPLEGAGAFLATHAAMSPELQSRLAVALYNAPPWMLQQGPLAASLPIRMMMAQGVAPPDTLPPNPAWGGDVP